MPGRTIIITGGSDGIGAAAARASSAAGETVVLVGRSPSKTQAIASELGVEYHVADFAELVQVRTLAATLLATHSRIDVLANNAGGIMGERVVTTDGHELTFQVNHLAPFLLTTLLLERLIDSRATVIASSSAANRLYARFDIEDLDAQRSYSANRAYGNAKLANILFTRELDVRYRSAGISAVAFHPGVVATSFAGQATSLTGLVYRSFLNRLLLSPERGADTLVWLATADPGSDWVPGEFYEKRKIQKANPDAYDPHLARRLWNASAAMVVPAP